MSSRLTASDAQDDFGSGTVRTYVLRSQRDQVSWVIRFDTAAASFHLHNVPFN